MTTIIPYENMMEAKEGAFITPGGEMIFTYGEHENFARDYCNGKEYDYLSRIKYGDSYDPDAFEYYKIKYNYQGKQEDIDNYSSTKLNKEQLKLYKLWIEDNEFSRRYDLSDFLVLLLSFDKVETIMRRCITTINDEPHVRFFNYYLMGWRIDRRNPMKYNYETNNFEYEQRDEWLVSQEDRDAEDEIIEIKKRVLIQDRPLFFK